MLFCLYNFVADFCLFRVDNSKKWRIVRAVTENYSPLNLGDLLTMTVYDLMQQYKNKSEEEQRRACVVSVLSIDDANSVLYAMGYNDDCLDNDEKASCLARAVDDGETDEDIRDYLQDNLQEAIDNARSTDDDDGRDPDYDEDDEHENGIEDDDDFLNRE